MPHIVTGDYSGKPQADWHGWAEPIEDFVKALCYLSGMDYSSMTPFDTFLRTINAEWGQWHYWGFFRFKVFKKGTGHFEFQDEELWGRFNQRIAKLKGYPLYESVKKTKNKETGMVLFSENN
jgi:hypothetical protein